nr:hypothetical protein [Caballeronia calidae]
MSALCAILCGADNWVAVQVWGEEKPTGCAAHQQDKRAIHLVSAYGAGLGLVLGQGPHGRQEQRNPRDTGVD